MYNELKECFDEAEWCINNENFNGAIYSLEKILSNNILLEEVLSSENVIDLYYELAISHFHKKNYKESAKYFEELIKYLEVLEKYLNNNNPIIISSTIGIYCHIAISYYYDKNYKKALLNCEKALAINKQASIMEHRLILKIVYKISIKHITKNILNNIEGNTFEEIEYQFYNSLKELKKLSYASKKYTNSYIYLLFFSLCSLYLIYFILR